MSIHKGLGGVGEPTETLEMRKSQMWLQSSFLVGKKSSSGSFPHGQGSQAACSADGWQWWLGSWDLAVLVPQGR